MENLKGQNLPVERVLVNRVLPKTTCAITEERRKTLVKHAHKHAEEGRVAVRNVRRDMIKDLREFEQEKMISKDDLEKGEAELQKITDQNIEEINAIGERKEKEIMEV